MLLRHSGLASSFRLVAVSSSMRGARPIDAFLPGFTLELALIWKPPF